MEIKPWFLWLITASFIITYAYLFVPEDLIFSTSIYPLWITGPKFDSIYAASWVDYATARMFTAVLCFTMWQALPIWGHELRIFFVLSVGYVADYFLTYNQPLVYLIPFEFTLTKPDWPGFYIPFGYPLLMVSIMIYVSHNAFKKWKLFRSYR